jgi:hypothetical protein
MFDQLAAPFPPEAVSWRVGNTNVNKQTGKPPEGKAASGMALAYIDARDVMDRLDAVCGPDGWQTRYTHVDKKTVCEIDIWVEGRGWVTKADGAGDSDIEAEKGALSDAFKRAAVRWGIGRYLYHLASPWVALDPMGRSWKIKDSEQSKLLALLKANAGQARQEPSASPPAPPAKPTLAQRAAALEDALKARAHDPVKLTTLFKANAGLCADLDAKDPERLVEITALYERLLETPEEVFA